MLYVVLYLKVNNETIKTIIYYNLVLDMHIIFNLSLPDTYMWYRYAV